MEKRCPTCNRKYVEENLNYCLADGSFLLTNDELRPSAQAPAVSVSDAHTEAARLRSNALTEVLPPGEQPRVSSAHPQALTTATAPGNKYHPQLLVAGALIIGVGIGVILLGVFLIGSFDSSADNLDRGSKTGPAANTSGKRANSSYSTAKNPLSDQDAAIQSRIEFQFKTDSELKDENILVTVKDANVTLSGSVGSTQQKIRADMIAKGIKGVKSIENLISVEP
jgi:hypothetical protein